MIKLTTAFFILLANLMSLPSYADDIDDIEPISDDDTMIVIEEGDTPEDIVNIISLPMQASDMAHENAVSGQETANLARELGREFGQAKAEEARNSNMGEQMREAHVPDHANNNRPDQSNAAESHPNGAEK